MATKTLFLKSRVPANGRPVTYATFNGPYGRGDAPYTAFVRSARPYGGGAEPLGDAEGDPITVVLGMPQAEMNKLAGKRINGEVKLTFTGTLNQISDPEFA